MQRVYRSRLGQTAAAASARRSVDRSVGLQSLPQQLRQWQRVLGANPSVSLSSPCRCVGYPPHFQINYYPLLPANRLLVVSHNRFFDETIPGRLWQQLQTPGRQQRRLAHFKYCAVHGIEMVRYVCSWLRSNQPLACALIFPFVRVMPDLNPVLVNSDNRHSQYISTSSTTKWRVFCVRPSLILSINYTDFRWAFFVANSE